MEEKYFAKYTENKKCSGLIRTLIEVRSLEENYFEGYYFNGNRWVRDDKYVREIHYRIVHNNGYQEVDEFALEKAMEDLTERRGVIQHEKELGSKIIEVCKANDYQAYVEYGELREAGLSPSQILEEAELLKKLWEHLTQNGVKISITELDEKLSKSKTLPSEYIHKHGISLNSD